MLEEQINLSRKDLVHIERYMTGDGYMKIGKRLNMSPSSVRYYLSANMREKNDIRSAKHRASRRGYRQKFLQRVLRKNVCSVCGYDDPIVLEFDHINPEEKVSSVSGMLAKGYEMERIKNEMRKCRILCANCHVRHTHKQNNSHRWMAFGEVIHE